MIITLAGHAGTGKTTVGKLLESKLGYKFHYTGSIFREMAKEKGMTVAEFQDSADNQEEIDVYLDGHQKNLGEENDNIIVDGHIAFHFIPHSFKVKLIVDPEEGAKRIYEQSLEEDRGSEKKYSSFKEALGESQARIKRHINRFKKTYDIDMDDLDNYDLVIDTTKIPPQEVVEQIIKALPSES